MKKFFLSGLDIRNREPCFLQSKAGETLQAEKPNMAQPNVKPYPTATEKIFQAYVVHNAVSKAMLLSIWLSDLHQACIKFAQKKTHIKHVGKNN